MEKIKLVFQNGHRNTTTGATGTSGKTSSGKKYNEVDWIDLVYYEIKKKIDSDPKLSSRIQLGYDDTVISNGAVADYFIAIHADGAVKPEYNGGFVDDAPKCVQGQNIIPCDLLADQSWKFAQKVADFYFGPMGIKFEPGHRTADSTYYYGFNYTGEKAKQFIIECGSMTNVSDMDKMSDITKVASSLLGGIIAYFKENEPLFKDYGTSIPPIIIGQDKDKEIADLKQKIETLQKQTEDKLAEKDRSCLLRLEAMKNELKNNIKNYVNGL